jgi:hypothetical protein
VTTYLAVLRDNSEFVNVLLSLHYYTLLIYLSLDYIFPLVFAPFLSLAMSSSSHLQKSVLFTPEDDRDMLDSLKGLSIKGFHDWYRLFVIYVHCESSHIVF